MELPNQEKASFRQADDASLVRKGTMTKSTKKKKRSQQDQQPIRQVEPVIDLNDTALKEVTGGLNPQPLPPRGPDDNAIMWS